MTRLVALDGRYAQFPAEDVLSPIGELDAIEAACAQSGVDLEYQRPVVAWPSEMAKRSHLFHVADTFTGDLPDDDAWYLILDADYEIKTTRPLPELLAGRVGRAAEAKLYMPPSARLPKSNLPPLSVIRTMFRGRGIRVEGNHYTYLLPDGTALWAGPNDDKVPAVDLIEQFTIVHHTFHRSEERMDAQAAYYTERDASGVERGVCEVCGQSQAVAFMPRDPRPVDGDDFDAAWSEVCAACIPVVAAENHEHARRLNIDPAKITRPVGVVRGAL